MLISLPIIFNVIGLLVLQGNAMSFGSGVSKDIDEIINDHLKSFKSEIERKYEAEFNEIRTEFKNELQSMTKDFDIKESEYKTRIESLERKISASCVLQEERKALERLAQGSGNKKNASNFGLKERGHTPGITKRQVSPEAENRVAFFASISKEVRHLGANQDIVFDKVVTNLGSAYNGHHGSFIAPVAGTYVFCTTLHAAGTETWGHFMVNGVIVAKIHLKGVQSSQTVIAHLNKGDDVSIQNSALDKGLHGDMYSTFGGFLLFEDTGFGSEIIGK